MCWASAPGYSPAIVATTWRGRSVVSSAHSTTAPRERSQPSRPARRTISTGSMSARERSSSRNEPRRFCSTSSRASSTATSVRQATAARCRNSSAVLVGLAEQQHAADRLVARGDRHLAADVRRHRGRAAAGAVGDVAAQRADVGHRAGRQRRRAEPRDHDRHRARPPPRRPAPPPARAPRRPAPRPPSSGGPSAAARRGAPARPDPAGSGAPRQSGRGLRPRRPTPAPRSPGGPAASPHRTRRCGSCRPPRPA